eukprot:scaffold21524_cov139-Skeletonema_dohrnii-CCMP3373.AAC.2
MDRAYKDLQNEPLVDFNAPIFTEIRSSPRWGAARFPPENEGGGEACLPHPTYLPTNLPTHICCQHGRQCLAVQQ